MSKSSHAKRAARLRQVLPGFPRSEPFTTIEEAKKYVSEDKVICLLCGQKKKAIGTHLIKLHSMSTEDYRQKYGIPYGIGLTGQPTKEKRSINAKAYLKSIGEDEMNRRLESGRASRTNGPQRIVSTVRTQRKDRIKTVHEAPPVTRECYLCGGLMTGSGVFAFRKYVTCPKHRQTGMSEESRAKLKRWETENPQRSEEYYKAKNWWGWQRNPMPLLEYAKKYGANLRILPELLKAANEASA